MYLLMSCCFSRGHRMMTSSYGNIFRVTGHLCGEFTGPRWIPHTKASDAELSCFLWSASDKPLSKHSRGWWFETLSRSFWRHCNGQPLYWPNDNSTPVCLFWCQNIHDLKINGRKWTSRLWVNACFHSQLMSQFMPLIWWREAHISFSLSSPLLQCALCRSRHKMSALAYHHLPIMPCSRCSLMTSGEPSWLWCQKWMAGNSWSGIPRGWRFKERPGAVWVIKLDLTGHQRTVYHTIYQTLFVAIQKSFIRQATCK